MEALFFVLACPLAGSVVLAVIGHRDVGLEGGQRAALAEELRAGVDVAGDGDDLELVVVAEHGDRGDTEADDAVDAVRYLLQRVDQLGLRPCT